MDYRDNKSSYQTNRYNEQVLSYTKAGAVTRLQRRGLKNDGKYGKIDNLHITLTGNRLHYVLDDAENLMYEGAVEFQGDESNGSAFGYNANGGLITDTGKGIMHIDYDDNNYPRRIQFANGNVTEYVYTATGEKLRAVHYTAVPNIEVGSGETHELTNAEILFKDSTDYHGSLIMENGVPAQYLFDGGYCKLTDSSGNPAVYYHYYDRDHLGNIRGVIDESGTVEQITNYYPFGAPYSDATTTNPTLQRYKYNGKELELMHGLKWYDYGARWYDPLLVSWNRPDPSHKDYYPWSPYAYCGDNPVNVVDPDGRDWYQNNLTLYYTWFDNNKAIDGYKYIGEKGSLLGEYEDKIDNILTKIYKHKSIYTNGSTIDISPNDKGGLLKSKERGWDFFDEFINGTGPEISILGPNHIYTKELMGDAKVIEGQNQLKEGESHYYTSKSWDIFDVLSTPVFSKQFIGSYRYDGYISQDNKSIINIISDSKSMSSFFYHITPAFMNRKRNARKILGNTYQFYIWTTIK